MKNKLFAFFSLIFPALIIVVIAVKNNNNTEEITQVNTESLKTVEISPSETTIIAKDSKTAVLEKFFELYKSPLKDHAQTFVDTAEKYNIDYKLLPAISCIESTCGKFIIEGSYNPFGWGITSKGHIAFNSFEEAIQKVGAGLNKGYFSKGLDTVSEIAPIYTPPNSQHWENGVNFFIYKMNELEKQHAEEELKNKVLNYL